MLSRDQLLDAVVGRRAALFDRSIDVLVGRLRRKIEPDPKQPSVIVTVTGEGYRFSAALTSAKPGAVTVGPGPIPVLPVRGAPWWRARSAMLAAAGLCLIPLFVTTLAWRPSQPKMAPEAGVIVLPFANLSGDSAQDYLGAGVASDLSTLLGTFPTLCVVSSPSGSANANVDIRDAAKAAGVRYVVHGGVHKLRDRMRFTAQLYDGVSGSALWANRFDADGANPLALQEEVANRIYDSLAGFRGSIRSDEVRAAWSKDAPGLDEYDYYLRGVSIFHRFTLADTLNARAIWREGLDKFPNSALLRVKLAFTYTWMLGNGAREDPRGDIEEAWRLAKAADAAQPKSRLMISHLHWLMAFLYQWHDNDFTRSVTEARAAVEFAPYDAMLRNDLSIHLANAGLADEAIEWAKFGLSHDANAPSWFHLNLAWAYYVGKRYQEAYDAQHDYIADAPAQFAAICVRLGRLDEAHRVIADAIKAGSKDSLAKEGLFPQIEPDRTATLNDMRAAGLPEN